MKLHNTPVQGRGFVQPENDNTDILVQHKQEARIDSRVVSERAGIQHKSLVSTIKKHQKQLRELETLPRHSLKEFSDLKSINSGRKRGRPEVSYLLNELQLDYMLRIVRGRDNERINRFKLDVTKAFAKRRAVEPVRREYLPGYHESRDSLKALGAKRHHYINKGITIHNNQMLLVKPFNDDLPWRIAGKTKATGRWSPVRTKEIKRITNNATFAAGGQCNQCGDLWYFGKCNSLRALLLMKSSSGKWEGYSWGSGLRPHLVSYSCWRACNSCFSLCIFFSSIRFFSCAVTRRSSSHYGAGGHCDRCSDLWVNNFCYESSHHLISGAFFRLWYRRDGGTPFRSMCLRKNSSSKNESTGFVGSASCVVFLFSSDIVVFLFTALRRSSSHHGAGGYSDSLVLRRWRRLISPRMAALINCPVLSPSSFTFSMPSIISWAIRAVTDCDFAFFGPVAMSNSLCFGCKTIYTKKNYFEGLTRKTLLFYIVSYTLLMQGAETTKPRTVGAVTGLLTTTAIMSNEVAMRNHTATQPQRRNLYNLNNTSEKNQLIAMTARGYDSGAPHKTGAGIGVLLELSAIHDAPASFFVSAHTHTLSMVGCMGLTSVRLVSDNTSNANPVQSTASEIGVSCGGYIPTLSEAATMATTPTLIHSQTAFLWRFIAFGASESQIIHVTAWTEREARNRCPSGCVAVFAARIRQGVSHD